MASIADELAALDAAAADGNTGKSGNSTTNKFQTAISAWRGIDLTNLVTELDTTASDIVAYQRDSTVQRKELAQKTKDFRKADDATKLAQVKGLLKSYQTFIDLLANHSKSVNSNFLKAYTSLSEAPDPYPLLEASVDSMLAAEETLPRLSEENERLQKSVAQLTSQLEETESRLQTERVARKEVEENLESRVKDVQSSWTLVMDEKKDNWEAKEKALEEKIESQERLIGEIKATYEVSQRLGQGETGDSAAAGVSSAELDMLQGDLERTSTRLAEVEARNEQLRVELAQATASASAVQKTGGSEDDPAYMRVRAENSSLMRKLEAARVERDGIRRDLDSKVRSVEREVGHLTEERDSLKTKLEKWKDYDDVKQELEVLKSIEFSTGYDDEDEEDIGGDETKAKGDTLEKLLLARNKKLADELTLLRVSHNEVLASLKSVQTALETTRTDLSKAHILNAKLENDLSTMQTSAAPRQFSSGASVAGTYVSRYQQSGLGVGRKGRVSPTSSIISGMPAEREASPFGLPAGGQQNAGILPMITAQRDRFKARNAQLEGELSDLQRTVSSLRQEVASLQRDNLSLYEKTRYISSYRGAATTSSSAAAAVNPNPTAVNIGSTGTPGIALDRYRAAYESNLSPFAAFRGREAARAYKRMGWIERGVWSVLKNILATRRGRNLFVIWCVGLHLFFFWILLGGGGVSAGAGAAGGAALHATSGDGTGKTWKAKGDDLH